MTALFNIGQIDYPAFAAEYRAYYDRHAPEEFAEIQRNRARSLAGDAQFLAGLRARALTTTGDEARLWWVKYRAMTTDQSLLRNLNMAFLNELLAEGPVTNAIAPYEIRPAALANVRAHLSGGKN